MDRTAIIKSCLEERKENLKQLQEKYTNLDFECEKAFFEGKSSIISTCSSYHISEIIALTIFPTRLRAICSIRVTLSRRIIS